MTSRSLRLAIRADSGTQIGTGHIRRSLALAKALRARGHAVTFISRVLEGRVPASGDLAGYDPVWLPAPERPVAPKADTPSHAVWAEVPWERDAVETAAALSQQPPDWLILDHYAFDARWQERVRATLPRSVKLMVWDDLADRRHGCDMLLDQNLGRRAEDYDALLPEECDRLIGPRFAILRPEFADLRARSLARRAAYPGLRQLLVSMGGVDLPNTTSAVLRAVSEFAPPLERITVVMGSGAPALAQVRALAAASAVPTDVVVDTPRMAELMVAADLAIGATGGTAWERCALGLPALTIVLADNQAPAGAALSAKGATLSLGRAGAPGLVGRLQAAFQELAKGDALVEMGRRASEVTVTIILSISGSRSHSNRSSS